MKCLTTSPRAILLFLAALCGNCPLTFKSLVYLFSTSYFVIVNLLIFFHKYYLVVIYLLIYLVLDFRCVPHVKYNEKCIDNANFFAYLQHWTKFGSNFVPETTLALRFFCWFLM